MHLNSLPNNSIAHSRLFIPAALPSSEEEASLSFLGPIKADEINAAIARGEINPMTHRPFKVHMVGEIVHVTSGDLDDGATRLHLTPPLRTPAPAMLQPRVTSAAEPGHRQPFLGCSQSGAHLPWHVCTNL
jgi:hypothetical protein